MILDGPLAHSGSTLVSQHYYVVVQWLTWVISVPPNALLMKYFVFRSKGRWHRQVARAYVVYLPSQIIGAVLLIVLVRAAHLGPILGQLVTAVIVTIVGYLGNKHFTFRVASGERRGGLPNP